MLLYVILKHVVDHYLTELVVEDRRKVVFPVLGDLQLLVEDLALLLSHSAIVQQHWSDFSRSSDFFLGF